MKDKRTKILNKRHKEPQVDYIIRPNKILATHNERKNTIDRY